MFCIAKHRLIKENGGNHITQANLFSIENTPNN